MEIVYSVSVKPDRDIEEEFVRWLQEEHIDEVVGTGCFDSYRFFRVLVEDESEGSTYNIQYITTEMSRYFDYIHDHAETMRQKGIDKFGGKIHAFRTVLKEM